MSIFYDTYKSFKDHLVATKKFKDTVGSYDRVLVDLDGHDEYSKALYIEKGVIKQCSYTEIEKLGIKGSLGTAVVEDNGVRHTLYKVIKPLKIYPAGKYFSRELGYRLEFKAGMTLEEYLKATYRLYRLESYNDFIDISALSSGWIQRVLESCIIRRKQLWGFNDTGVFGLLSREEALKKRNVYLKEDNTLSVKPFKVNVNLNRRAKDGNTYKVIDITYVLDKLKKGSTIEDLKIYVDDDSDTPNKRRKLNDYELFVHYIYQPKVCREPENTNRNTFDYIKVEVSLVGPYRESNRELIHKYLSRINREVIGVVENSIRFQKYGLPVNILKISDIVWRRDNILEYTLELKDIQ